MIMTTTYTASVPQLCGNPVKIGASRIWWQTITATNPNATDVALSTKDNTYWSIDGSTWYNATSGEKLVNPTQETSFTMWFKFVPAFVNDTPGEVGIKTPAVP